MGNVVERGVHDGLPWLLHGADDARHQAVLAYLGVEGGHSGTCRDKNVDEAREGVLRRDGNRPACLGVKDFVLDGRHGRQASWGSQRRSTIRYCFRDA